MEKMKHYNYVMEKITTVLWRKLQLCYGENYNCVMEKITTVLWRKLQLCYGCIKKILSYQNITLPQY